MTDLAVHRFPGWHGVELAYREIGRGRPLVLIHGFLATGLQWVRSGHAATLAARGHRVILPDLRGHGDSARPHDPAAYPPDVLADDGLALIESLQLDEYDLAGYSLGGRVVLRMLARGARPGRAIVAGQGWDATSRSTSRTGRFRQILTGLAAGGPWEPGSPESEAARRFAEAGVDPVAQRFVLDTHVDTPREELARIEPPTLVAVGGEDERAGADELAAALPNGRFLRVPGDHATALSGPVLVTAMADFLDADPAGASVG